MILYLYRLYDGVPYSSIDESNDRLRLYPINLIQVMLA